MSTNKLNFSEALLVLGMHRSGSSALTRSLSLLGYALPKNLIKDNSTNLRGHWECQPIARLNDSYLAEAGLTWSDWSEGRLNRISEAFRQNFLEDLKRHLASEFPTPIAPVIKEPRIGRLVETYKDFFAENDVSVRFIVTFRHPHEVASSLDRRNGIGRVDSALLWLRYVVDSIAATKGEKCAFVAYDKFLEDPINTLSHVCDTLSLNPRYRLQDASDEIGAFLSADLRHHTHRTEDLIHDDLTRGWISDVYEALRILARNPTASEAFETILRVRSEINAALPFFEGALSHARDELADVNAALNKATTSSDMRAEQVRILRSEKIQTARLHDEVEATLRAKAQEAEKERTELSSLAAKLQKVEQERTELFKSVKKLEIERTELSTSVKELKKTERRLKRRYLRLQDELAYRKDMLTNLHNSTMWRLTAPLRRAVETYRSVGHSFSTRLAGKTAKEPSNPKNSQTKPTASSPVSDATKANLVRESKLFDQAWYLASYPDAQLHPTGAAAHYVSEGWRKGYNPSAAFNTDAYIASHKDILNTDECPLIHYLSTTNHRKPTAQARHDGAKIAVFTAIAGEYDLLVEPARGAASADFYAFTDGDGPASSVWKPEPFEYVSGDPTRTARFIKTHPHLYFQDYDWAIWLDGNLILNCDPKELLPVDDSVASVFTWKHPLRNCVYDEGKECIRRDKDEPKIIDSYLDNLRKEKFPAKAGLFETSVFVTRIGAPNVKKFYDTWWAEIDRGSKRDQLSLPYAIKKSGATIGFLGEERMCMRTDPRVLYHRHVSHNDDAH